MKTKIRHIIIATILLGFASAPAQAGDEAVAAIGGFLAGVITGSVISDHDDHYRHSSHHSNVHVSVGHRSRSYYSYSSPRPRSSGYYTYRKMKIWVPGYWEYTRSHCGSRIKVWREGYYRYETRKVWVPRRTYRSYSYCD